MTDYVNVKLTKKDAESLRGHASKIRTNLKYRLIAAVDEALQAPVEDGAAGDFAAQKLSGKAATEPESGGGVLACDPAATSPPSESVRLEGEVRPAGDFTTGEAAEDRVLHLPTMDLPAGFPVGKAAITITPLQGGEDA